MNFFVQNGDRGPKRFIGPALILLAAAVAVAPQIIRGNSCGHDFDVHLVSWIDCVNAWHHGIVYPHWTPSPNYGAGEPRFVFYPPLTWLLGALLGVVLPWNLAPIALTFLTLAATGWATRALAREALDDAPATLAGCAAIFSGFALFTGYERSSFPEFAGGLWLPLIVLFALRDRRPQEKILLRAFDGSAAPLAIALAGAWLSNLPLGVMAGYLMAGVALAAAGAKKSWAPLVRAAVAGTLGLGLAAIYWLPAALERHWVDIRQATEDPGYNFENNWLFKHNANPVLALHDQVLRQVSWIAVSMVAVAIVGAIVSWRRATLPAQKTTGSRRWWIPLAAIPAVILFLIFPISRPLWHALPEMAFLQYPWRWLEALEAPMAIFFAAAVWPAGRKGRVMVAALCSIAFLGATVYAATQFFQVCDEEDSVAGTLASYRAGAGFEGMWEYAPPQADLSQVATGLPDACLVADPATALGKPASDDPDANPVWSADQGSCLAIFTTDSGQEANPEHRHYHLAISQPGWLVLRLESYPAWRIRLNGQLLTSERFTSLPKRNDGLIAIPVSQGPAEIAIDWTTTPDVLAGRWATGLSILLLIALFVLERRRGALV
jgi:hypothetical protein